MKIRRNDICHCGSGKKYKQCHQLKKNSQSNQFFFFGIIAFIIVLIVFLSNLDLKVANNPNNISPSPFSLDKRSASDQPSVQSAAGKVWSVEHGHWHDDPNFQTKSTLGNNFVNKPTITRDTKSLGKVWNNNHGHYHDN